MSKLKNGKRRRGKDSTPPNFNQPAFEAKSSDRETAKKKVMAQLERQGISGADKLNAMNRGKHRLTLIWQQASIVKTRTTPKRISDECETNERGREATQECFQDACATSI